MPVIRRIINDSFSIFIWKSIESMQQLEQTALLNPDDEHQLSTFKSETRKREWLTVRNVLNEMNGMQPILYDLNGKPFLKGDKCISISHSNDYIAVMTAHAKRIGVDIENIHPRIKKLSDKFLSDEEKSRGQSTSLEVLHLYWGAKEVLYKLHSIGGINFKKDLYVHPFSLSDEQFSASIRKRGFEATFSIFHEQIDEYMLTWGVEY